MSELRRKTSSSKTRLYLVNEAVMTKLDIIADTENLPKDKVLEKLIMNYVPVPFVLQEGEFRSIRAAQVSRLRKIKPQAIIMATWIYGKLGIHRKTYWDYKNGKLTWEEYRRQYIERLMLPDAQAEIARLRKLRTTQDIYITSFERDEEYSLRKLFIDFVNGKLVWT